MSCTMTATSMALSGMPALQRGRCSQRAAFPAAAAAIRMQPRRQRRAAVVKAVASPEEPEQGGAVQNLARSAERVLARYDFLSAGMGALAVTGFCVARGQDVGTALWITAASTVVALLVNDTLPEDF